MDDKTPDPEQTPDATPAPGTTPTPDATPTSMPAADAPTVPVTPASEAATPGAPAEGTAAASAASADGSKPGRKRALLIGGGIAAAIVLAGGGIAIGATLGDDLGDDDDHPSISDGSHHGDDGRPGDERGGDGGSSSNGEGGQGGDGGGRGGDGGDDGGRGGNGGNGGPVTGIGTVSADELIEIADAARGVADGEVTSIDAKRDGTWEIELTDARGRETDVRVDDTLTASVVATDGDDDDSAPALTLDDAAIRSLVAAALAEVDGVITDLDVDGDDASPYDASVLTSDRRSIDIDFGADFAVVGTDIDD